MQHNSINEGHAYVLHGGAWQDCPGDQHHAQTNARKRSSVTSIPHFLYTFHLIQSRYAFVYILLDHGAPLLTLYLHLPGIPNFFASSDKAVKRHATRALHN